MSSAIELQLDQSRDMGVAIEERFDRIPVEQPHGQEVKLPVDAGVWMRGRTLRVVLGERGEGAEHRYQHQAGRSQPA